MPDRKSPRLKQSGDGPIPVTLLSGFLGAGKTTLLLNILRNKDKLRCAVIVNDMASLNIDAAIVEKAEILQRKEEMVQMQNGCICCTLRGDLLKEVGDIANSGKFDYIVIESTGISEPMQVAETFAASAEDLLGDSAGEMDETVESLVGVARLDTCVTVVDAANFFDYLGNTKYLNQALADAEDDDTERTVANLLIEQVEFANVVILNKASLVSKETLQKLKGLIISLNPSAEIITTDYSKVPVTKLLNTEKFDMKQAEESNGWMDSLTEGHTPETEEYGISSFLYNPARPFHSDRLLELLTKYFILVETGYEPVKAGASAEEGEAEEEEKGEEDDIGETENEDEGEEDKEDEETARAKLVAVRSASHWKGLMRSKGYFRLATRPRQMGSWAQAGTMLSVDCAGTVEVDDEEEEDEEEEGVCDENDAEAANKKGREARDGGDEDNADADADAEGEEEVNEDEVNAAAGQKLVLIGAFVGDEKELIKKDLDSCLMTDDEMALFNKGELHTFEDAWEDWPPVAEDDEGECMLEDDDEADADADAQEEEKGQENDDISSAAKRPRIR